MGAQPVPGAPRWELVLVGSGIQQALLQVNLRTSASRPQAVAHGVTALPASHNCIGARTNAQVCERVCF